MTKKGRKAEAHLRVVWAVEIARSISPDWPVTKRVSRALLIFDTMTIRRMAKKVGLKLSSSASQRTPA